MAGGLISRRASPDRAHAAPADFPAAENLGSIHRICWQTAAARESYRRPKPRMKPKRHDLGLAGRATITGRSSTSPMRVSPGEASKRRGLSSLKSLVRSPAPAGSRRPTLETAAGGARLADGNRLAHGGRVDPDGIRVGRAAAEAVDDHQTPVRPVLLRARGRRPRHGASRPSSGPQQSGCAE